MSLPRVPLADPVSGITTRISAADLPVEVATRRSSLTRDVALDTIRGIAILLMVATHVGPATHIVAAMHVGSWELSPADLFIVTSGVVIGMRAALDIAEKRSRALYHWLWRRAFRLYLLHCVLTLLVVLVHEFSGQLRSRSVAELNGWPHAILAVLELRDQPADFMNILPLYVVFLALSPLVFATARRGLTGLMIAGSFFVWSLAQRFPSLVPLPDPRFGEVSFSVAAWQFPFVLGLMVGFHRERLARFWATLPWMPRVLAFAVTAFLFAPLQLNRHYLHAVGLTLLPASFGVLFAKSTWAPLRATYVSGMMHFGYLGLRRSLVRIDASDAWPLAVVKLLLESLQRIGKRSLYCFQLHLLFALLASLVGTQHWPLKLQELVVLASIGMFLALARRNFAAKYLVR